MKPFPGFHALAAVVVASLFSVPAHAAGALRLERAGATVDLVREGKSIATYNLQAPPNSGLPVDVGGYFHPLRTPKGVVVTDFVPSDHKHHRGLFLAWVELHAAKDSDFWGWGALAPIKERRIVNRSFTPKRDGFQARNDWTAEDQVVIEETLTAKSRRVSGVDVLDLEYRIVPRADTVLGRVAFSGFCLRVRKDGDIRFVSPDGPVDRPNPVYNKPESDWPNAAWYASEQTLPDGARIGAAVLNHPSNPASLWHNHRDVRMMNPCIVAPGAVSLTAGKPLVLKYRVVTFDGATPTQVLNSLTRDWK